MGITSLWKLLIMLVLPKQMELGRFVWHG
jgi:hypothetical protein